MGETSFFLNYSDQCRCMWELRNGSAVRFATVEGMLQREERDKKGIEVLMMMMMNISE